ncbi:class I SAM-dependent methyltransferase [Streptacidiphilus sp. EB103A]|uniref:class I SAM-dependent DNA methyltransferase n=1 Tax=Streptacidiphilus sp. EB103A TaxID=3156275 RepID=UPI003515D9B2
MTDTWDTIADSYAERLRKGSAMHEFARDILLEQLPDDLTGLRIVDLGCGEGIVARALALRGAGVRGVDLAPRMIAHAWIAEAERPTGAVYTVDDGCTLATIGNGTADCVTAGLSLNNVRDLKAALAAVSRVLLPGGRLVFTIPHPCFEAPGASWAPEAVDDDPPDTRRRRRTVGDYLTEGFWRSTNPEGARRAGNQHRTLSTYLGALLAQGFALEAIAEPAPPEPVRAEQPLREGLPPFLVVTGRRSG